MISRISFVIASAAALMIASSAQAERGDNSEGQGGGRITRDYYHADPLTREKISYREVRDTKTVSYPCIVSEPVSASLLCNDGSSSTVEQFVDFTSGCQVIPAHTRNVQSTCQKDEVTVSNEPVTEIENFCNEGGKLLLVRHSFDIRGKYKKHSPSKIMCQYPKPQREFDFSDNRGNVGNR